MWDETVAGTRERRLRALDRLLAPAGRRGRRSPLRRPLCAALARACEGLVRDELAEIGELVLLLGARLARARGLHRAGRGHGGPRAEGGLPGDGRRCAPAGRAAARAGRRAEAAAVRGGASGAGRGAAAGAVGAGRGPAAGAAGHRPHARAGGPAPLAAGPDGGAGAPGWLDLPGRVRAGPGRAERRGVAAAGPAPAGGREHRPGARPLRALDAAVAARRPRRTSPSWTGRCRRRWRACAPICRGCIGRGGRSRALARLPDAAGRGAATRATRPGAAARRSCLLPTWLPPSRVLGGFYVLRPIGRGRRARCSWSAGPRSATTQAPSASPSRSPRTTGRWRTRCPRRSSCGCSARRRARC